jgi:hypothetical protein
MTEPSTITFDCGCTTEVDHVSGERLVHCGGRRRGDVILCPGGIRHVVHADEVRTILYTTRRLDPELEAAE